MSKLLKSDKENIAQLLAAGFQPKKIAARLQLDYQQVKNFVKYYRKTGVKPGGKPGETGENYPPSRRRKAEKPIEEAEEPGEKEVDLEEEEHFLGVRWGSTLRVRGEDGFRDDF